MKKIEKFVKLKNKIDNCFSINENITKNYSISFPIISIRFNNKTNILWKPKDYLEERDSNRFCFLFIPHKFINNINLKKSDKN